MTERAEPKPTKRVVLMEFQANGKAIANSLGEEGKAALMKQLGVEDFEALDRPIEVLIPVARASGGPKAVIESEAKARGRFRAIADDAFSQGHEAIPPEQQKFELKQLSS